MICYLTPKCTYVVDDVRQIATNHQSRSGINRGATKFVALTDRKCHTVSLMRSIGMQNHIGSRVVRVGVIGIRTRQCSRRTGSKVMG